MVAARSCARTPVKSNAWFSYQLWRHFTIILRVHIRWHFTGDFNSWHIFHAQQITASFRYIWQMFRRRAPYIMLIGCVSSTFSSDMQSILYGVSKLLLVFNNWVTIAFRTMLPGVEDNFRIAIIILRSDWCHGYLHWRLQWLLGPCSIEINVAEMIRFQPVHAAPQPPWP